MATCSDIVSAANGVKSEVTKVKDAVNNVKAEVDKQKEQLNEIIRILGGNQK